MTTPPESTLTAAGGGYRVWYAGPEPQMVPATLADFECAHGLIGGCIVCDTSPTAAAQPTTTRTGRGTDEHD